MPIIIGQLAPFFAAGAATLAPLRTSTIFLSFGARYAFSLLGAGGDKTVSGITKEAGVPVARRVLILTQPPQPKLVYEVLTKVVDGAFTFRNLPPGNYLVLDCALDNSRQALVYDWVVPV